ncbi:DUF748 domain-containing protein [Azoarcus sp. L1K30]|uniref:DUF748 domain-containing protein n=1 Tax=Azoarcus sp. L1K30 TaxID=2820277 RepID=UPI001B811286|nr:DUF748 domain-containing protein [Azoarcus sp. L1K30]MBR0564835.1 DUF748 domain-containing protein [Azoarcus sp. L1K30]
MSDSTPGPIPQPRLQRLLRPAKWGVGVLLAVAAIGFGVVPPVARHYAIKIGGEMLGREVAIDGVMFNPFTLATEVRGVRVMSADGQQPDLSVARVDANFELESIIRGGPVLHSFAVDGLQLAVVRLPEGRHNWSDVLERLDEQPEREGEMHFSVGNIQVSNSRVTVDDKVTGLRNELTDIQVGVPFVSNLPVKVDVFVEPALSAMLNGQPLGISGRSKPFSDERETVVDLTLKHFELSPWMAYLPFEPAFKLPSGVLGADLQLSFRQPVDASPVVALSGQVQIDQLLIQDKAGQPALSAAEFGIELADVQPLVNRYQFSKLRLMQPEVDLVRLADGGINLMQMLPQPSKKVQAKKAAGTAKVAKKVADTPAGTPPATAAAQPGQIDFLLASARIRDGVLRFEDRTVAGPFKTRIDAINLDLRDLSTTGDMPAEIRLDYVSEAGEKLVHQDSLRLVPFELDGSVTVEQLLPARYAPYLAAVLPNGEVRGGRIDGALRYKVALKGDEPQVELNAEALTLKDFVFGLKGEKGAAVKVPELNIRNAQVQSGARKVSIGELELKRAAVSTIRQRNGDFDLMALGAKAGGSSSAKPQGDKPWIVTVGKLGLDGASVRVEDRSAGKPVVLQADGIMLKVEDFSSAKGTTLKLDLKSRINERGKIGAAGSLSLDPLKTALALEVDDVDLLPLQPYVLEETKIAISRGSLSTKGKLVLASARDGGLEGRFSGDLGVADFSSVDRLNSTDFVRWRALNLNDVDLHLSPFALSIRDVALSDFYTRLILSAQGKLNLRELQPEAEAAASERAKAEAALADGQAQRAAAPIKIGRISVKGGNIAFSDRFVRPNYDANLTGMSGELSGLSSDPKTIAKLKLQGKVDKSAPVSISGELNPFRQDQYLNIGASVKDFELTGLSGYSGKYVGYGIERGKLSAQVNYRIEARKLSATNNIFLDQLTFGEAVDSPDAVKLPIQLAVSLLKNSRGEINLDLPVSGTMDDPDFSVGGLVVRALFNLIGKAITSPFALLGSVVSGGENLSRIEFDPGVAQPGPAQIEKLTTLAKAMVEREGLRLDIVGQADAATDVEGIRHEKLLDKLRAVKLKAMLKRGESPPPLAEIGIAEDEYPVLLKALYDETDIEKPRNFFGIAKTLPVAEMEALLLPTIKVDDEDVQALAQQRAQVVREWLVTNGQVPAERVFMVKPKADKVASGRLVLFSLR